MYSEKMDVPWPVSETGLNHQFLDMDMEWYGWILMDTRNGFSKIILFGREWYLTNSGNNVEPTKFGVNQGGDIWAETYVSYWDR